MRYYIFFEKLMDAAERNIKDFRSPAEQREAQKITRSVRDVVGGAMVGVLKQIASDPGSERAQVFVDRGGGKNPVVIETRWESDRLNQERQETATRLLSQAEAALNNNWQFFLTQNEKSRLQAEKNNQGVVASLKGNGLARARRAMEDTARLMGEIDLRSQLPGFEAPRAPSRGSDLPPLPSRTNEAPLSLTLGAGLLTTSGAKKELKGLRGFLVVTTAAAALVGCGPTPTPRPEPVATSGYQPIAFEPTATEAVQVERVVLQDQSTATVINADIIRGLSIGGEKLPTLAPEGGEGIVLSRPLEELVRLNWGEDFMEKVGPQTSVQALKAYISAAGSVAASEEVRKGATIDLARTYPGLKESLRLFCGQIIRGKGWEEVLTEATPLGATLKNEVGIFVVGRYRQGIEEAQVVLGFNDWVYVGADGQLVSREVPRVSFAIIKEKDLPRLLQMINPAITYQDGVIVFPGTKDGREVIYEWFINTFSPESYLEVEREAGLEYIATAKNPVVPFPPEELLEYLKSRLPKDLLEGLPEDYSSKEWQELIRKLYSHKDGERGIYPLDAEGNLGEKAVWLVEYNEETKGWKWSRVEVPEPESKERITYGEVKLYHNPGEAYFSVLVPGRTLTLGREQGDYVEISVTENNGATWTAWIQKSSPYAKIGEVPTAEAPRGRFPKEINLSEVGLIFRNTGPTNGVDINNGGWKDQNGNYCPGSESCPGRTHSMGMAPYNLEYVRQVFAKYRNAPGGGQGKNLIIDVYNYTSEDSKVTRYECIDDGQNVVVRVGINSRLFSPNRTADQEGVLNEITSAMVKFCVGDFEDLHSGNAMGARPIPKDVMAMWAPTKIVIK